MRVARTTFQIDDVLDFAKEQYPDLNLQKIKFHYSGHNDIYFVSSENQEYVVRVTQPLLNNINQRNYDFEGEILEYLYSNDFPVPQPVLNLNEKYVSSFQHDEVTHFMTLMKKLEGSNFDIKKVNGVINKRDFGRSIGSFHLLLQDFKSHLPRFNIDADYLVHDPLAGAKKFFEYEERINDYNFLEGIAKETLSTIGNVLNNSKQVIHGDLYFANIIEVDNRYHIFDFELSGYGNPLYDLGCFAILNKYFAPDHANEFLEYFVLGYMEKIDFEDDFELILEFGKLRLIWNLKVWINSQDKVWPGQMRNLIDRTIVFLKRINSK